MNWCDDCGIEYATIEGVCQKCYDTVKNEQWNTYGEGITVKKQSKTRIDRAARIAEYIKNVSDILENAEQSELFEQAWIHADRWYKDAHNYAVELSDYSGLTIEQTAGIIAACSIQTRWDKNLIDAGNIVNHLPIYGLGIRQDKSIAIRDLNGDEAASKVAILGILNGPKITSFFLNILDPENSTAVTIDTWMRKALKIEQKSVKGTRYEDAVIAVQTVASQYGMTPLKLQALIWVLVRGKAD